ncbi:hypothetical protein SPRG_12348 [Saprolegnia parasitica CBS 223.65]|uniref:tRNA-dihydrouridine(16/17) synthase [NAD(P)(+)] n=1 Tax=Saprolegnia parasitica (strain CBS 223.65) TaxID=695850 RepID=A0A067C4W2_SAPPC|nr:hypothetical protein SPRG_12348 [Saprolegnia parasitica CBS 223.65]KDO21847.1 hypothetical protein SPRG_12348 [Saprolegnia parasitica CBS 223.65]|eukprot:XP_012207405.1 hypothetical protein SPRG_12348 [Saprolegnia parasitica CBS 223.65]
MTAPAWRWYNDVLGAPRFVCAPMVRASELAFRLLTRELGCDLTFSPMLHATELVAAAAAAPAGTDISLAFLDTSPADRPLIVQLCGNDPTALAAAVQLVQHRCDGIDLNLGCPQRCAEIGGFGAYLLEQPDTIVSIVRAMVAASNIPISCKIRLLPSLDETIALAQGIQAAGCAMLTVHGRLRAQRHHEGVCNWDAIGAIRKAIAIPMLANGGIRSRAEAEACLAATGCQAVMAATGLLENPSIFAVEPQGIYDVALRYLAIVAEQPRTLYPTAARDHVLTMFRHKYRETDMDVFSVLGHHDVLLPAQLEAVLGHIAARNGDPPCTRYGTTLPTLRAIRYNAMTTTEDNDTCADEQQDDDDDGLGFAWMGDDDA